MTSYLLTLSYGCGEPMRIKAVSDAAKLEDAIAPLTVWELDGRRPTFPMTVAAVDVSDGKITRTAAADGTLGPPTHCTQSNFPWWLLVLLVLLVVGALVIFLNRQSVTLHDELRVL